MQSQAKRTHQPASVPLSLRAGTSIALIVTALAALVAIPGRSGLIAAGLCGAGALTAWVTMLMIDLVQGKRRRRAPKARQPMRARRRKAKVVAPGEQDDARIQPGDYFSSGRSLYRVEHLAGPRVLIEDCRSGELLDIDRDSCAALQRVKRSG